MEEFPLENAGFDPIEFQLANGNRVRVAFGLFWEEWAQSDQAGLTRPLQFYAIRVYSSQDILSNRMAMQYEFRAGYDFNLTALPKIWQWLENLIATRKHADFDWLEDFTEEFAEEVARISNAPEDAVDHLEHLPELNDPEAFDHEDDSIYNDQNEPDAPQDSQP